MPLFRCILVAVDFSDRSKAAFHLACSLAHETKTRVYVVHVVEPAANQTIAYGEFGVVVPTVVDPTKYLDSLLADLRREYVPNHPVDVECLVRTGLIPETIIHISKDVHADVIVMGTHGRSGLMRVLAGSVAEEVLRLAPCPVLALRDADEAAEPGKDLVILHATDFSPDSESALQVARALAQQKAARLVIVHVLPVEVLMYGTEPVTVDTQAVRLSLNDMARAVDGPDLKYPVETRLLTGESAATIAGLARELGCGMIVIGTHGRTGLRRLLLGSVAESVLRRSPCPVLLVKPSQGKATATASQASAQHVAHS